MKIDTNNQNHILAEEGMVFKRISDGFIYGEDLSWIHYYLGGELLETSFIGASLKHFEEIEKPELDNEVELILEQ